VSGQKCKQIVNQLSCQSYIDYNFAHKMLQDTVLFLNLYQLAGSVIMSDGSHGFLEMQTDCR
jgi:hypothetical protein